MKVQALSIVTGSAACNARCPFCVSRQTPANGVDLKQPEFNWRNLHRALRLAQVWNVTTVLLTGKGEPTLYPDQLGQLLEMVQRYNFPFIDLQTNALDLFGERVPEKTLRHWRDHGLTTVAISIVHWHPERSRQVYTPHRAGYMDLADTVRRLHEIGFSVRLSATLLRGFIDSVPDMEGLISVARRLRVAQLTVRNVAFLEPELFDADARDAAEWARAHQIPPDAMDEIRAWIKTFPVSMHLPHGATVHDVHGQNLCLTDCLTETDRDDRLRQLIFFPDGSLRTSWGLQGSRLL